ncbi:MAG: response regulator transcription factor [Thermoleophilaceae bacterium]
MARTSRILLADDHALVRRGLRLIVDAEPDLEVVAEAGDGVEVLEHALKEQIDLAILDVSMPRLTGLQAAHELAGRAPQVKTVVLSMHDDEQVFFDALRAGAGGYVLKSSADHELVAACRAALRGQPFFYPEALKALVRDYLELDNREEGYRREDSLTLRESEVVKLLAEGFRAKEVSRVLNISAKTVERHRANVYAKLDITDRVQLVRYAIRRGLVHP